MAAATITVGGVAVIVVGTISGPQHAFTPQIFFLFLADSHKSPPQFLLSRMA